MIHPEVTKLLQEVFGWLNEEDGKRAGEYPEVYLVSLLEGIKERMPEVSAMLYSTVDRARFGSDAKRFQKVLAAVQPSEKVQSRKVGKSPAEKIRRGYARGELVNR